MDQVVLLQCNATEVEPEALVLGLCEHETNNQDVGSLSSIVFAAGEPSTHRVGN
jgi:hypothetical protein